MTAAADKGLVKSMVTYNYIIWGESNQPARPLGQTRGSRGLERPFSASMTGDSMPEPLDPGEGAE